MDVARIFDVSERPSREKQDKASILVLAALLGRADVKARLGQTKLIADFLTIAGQFDIAGSKEKSALGRLRQFRTQRLAHALFNEEPDQLPNSKTFSSCSRSRRKQLSTPHWLSTD